MTRPDELKSDAARLDNPPWTYRNCGSPASGNQMKFPATFAAVWLASARPHAPFRCSTISDQPKPRRQAKVPQHHNNCVALAHLGDESTRVTPSLKVCC